jgi:hypothetical protein
MKPQFDQYQPIKINTKTFLWDADAQSYFDGGGSCGEHGAKLQDGKWLPLWTPADSYDTQFGSKSFDTVTQALHESHHLFS